MTKKELYKFKVIVDPNMDEYSYKLLAEPNMSAISNAYRQISEGIDQELIDKMPLDAVEKLLSQLLVRYRHHVADDMAMALEDLLYDLGRNGVNR